ncbi:hypothetical protein SEPCBS119000_001337 [Sporothrix epigloea]|uniref:Uncharacterized protein n=1 Tax=Sporothrix epigloea TaxID=1892477 RepID=A0ABP0DA54_9PEZI
MVFLNTPVISKTYPVSACNHACSAPYQAEMCGGSDSSTFELLYNLYEISGSSGAGTTSTTSPLTSTTMSKAATTLESQATSDDVVGTPTTPTDGSTFTTTGIATQAPIVHAANPAVSTVDTTVFISILDCSCTDGTAPNTVVTSTVKVTATVPCSEGETNISGQCFASSTQSTPADTQTIRSSSTAAIHPALASESSPPSPSSLNSNSSALPTSLPLNISFSASSASSGAMTASSSICSESSEISSASSMSIAFSSSSITPTSPSVKTPLAVSSTPTDPSYSTSSSVSPGKGSSEGGRGHAINAALGSHKASTSLAPSHTMISSIASAPAYHSLSANSSTSSSTGYGTLANNLTAITSTISSAHNPAAFPTPAFANVSTQSSALTFALVSSPTALSSPFNNSYQYSTTEEVLITVVPLSTAPTTLSTLTSALNNHQNGPYANGTATSSRYSAPSYLSASAYASGNSMIVTAAGAPSFERASLFSKEWYLSMVALTMAFVLL